MKPLTVCEGIDMQTLRVQALILLMLCAISSTLKAAPSRPFTVQDSIEMSTFSDPFTRHPGDVCKMSPDGAHFLVVTTRGVLKRNELVSTVWLFNVKEVTTYTNSSHLDRPRPSRLEEVSVSPNALQNDSYGAVITKT